MSSLPAAAARALPAVSICELYRRMALVRGFETRVAALYAAGEIPGFVHVSVGQEAAAVGACWPLRAADVITSTHRGHGHCIAKGLDPAPMFAELMAKDSGTNRGRGGSMHICDPAMGVFGANGIVAGGVPIAVGAAFAASQRRDGDIAVAFFGDGAVGQGAFHEAVNLAAVWRLPVVFFCENNRYAEFSPAHTQHPVELRKRAEGYGLAYVEVDGNDVVAVASVMRDVVADVRLGAGPALVEAHTYRWHGHYEGDPLRYRDAAEADWWRAERDPLAVLRSQAADFGADSADLDAIDAEVDRQLDLAVEQARAGLEPKAEDLALFVTAPRRPVTEGPVAGGETFRYMDAVHDALEASLEGDPSVFVAGIDVGAGGNVFGITRGLADRWPSRVRDTPISESAIVGLAVGAAMAGMRPVVEVMYLDFIAVCFDQIVNQAAKLRYMTGGRAELGLVIRTQFGAGRSSGSQHSQSWEALLAHIPGLTVVMPSTPADAYGLLRASIADPNPVVFIEHRHLYGQRGPKPPPGHVVPIGRAAVVRPGRDVTVVSASRMVHECLAAADALAADGIEAEVIDLRTIAPFDREAVLASVQRTGRLVVAHEAVTDFGFGAEVAAFVSEHAFWALDAPVVRVGAAPTPAPYAPGLERAWLPDAGRIAAAIRRTVAE